MIWRKKLILIGVAVAAAACLAAAVAVVSSVSADKRKPSEKATGAGDPSAPFLESLEDDAVRAGAELAIEGRGFGERRGRSYAAVKRPDTGGVYICPRYSSWSDKRIVLEIPAVRSGDYLILVTTCFGSSNSRSLKVEPFKVRCGVTGGRGSVTPVVQEVDYGESASVDLRPAEGYGPEEVVDNGVERIPEDPFVIEVVTGDHQIGVEFSRLPTFSFSTEVGPGGSISTEGPTLAERGSSKTFSINPEAGYRIKQVAIDSVPVGPVSSYTFNEVADDHVISASFEPAVDPAHTVTAVGGAGGVVTPSGVHLVPPGGSITFTAAPSGHHHVSDVTVDGRSVGAVSDYVFVDVAEDHLIEASFARNTVTVSSSSGPGGTVTPEGRRTVTQGNDLSFEVNPQAGFEVVDVRVDGRSLGALPALTLRGVTDDHEVTASFAPIKWTVVSSAGTGGSISPPGTRSVEDGGGAVFAIRPDAHYRVSQVLIDGRPAGPLSEYAFTDVRAHHTIEANFEHVTWTVRANAGPNGRVDPGGSRNVFDGYDFTCFITADEHYRTSDVKIDGVSIGPVSSYAFENVTGDHTIEASFEKIVRTVTAVSEGRGSLEPAGRLAVDDGGHLTFRMEPEKHHHLSDVMVDGVSIGRAPVHVLSGISSDHTIEAVFAQTTWLVTASAGANGTVSPAGLQGVPDGGDQVFTISPDPNYHIADVRVDGVSVGAVSTYSFAKVTAHHDIEADFVRTRHMITSLAGAHGTIDREGIFTAPEGEDLVFRIKPDEHHKIDDVILDGSSMGPVSSLKLPSIRASHNVVARFEPILWTLKAKAGRNGTISPIGVRRVRDGGDARFRIEPREHYHVKNVTVDGVRLGPLKTYVFSDISADHLIEAEFELTKWRVRASPGPNGSIYPRTRSVADGKTLTMKIEAHGHYRTSDVRVDGVSVGPVNRYTFREVKRDHDIEATFEPVRWTLSGRAGPNGSIEPAGTRKVKDGESQTFRMKADRHHHVSDVIVDGVSVGPVTSYTFSNVTASHVVEASFALTSRTVTCKAGKNGSVDPDGTRTIKDGDSLTCRIAPDAHYEVDDVEVNGKSVGAVTTYTFRNIAADVKLEASFRRARWKTSATAGRGGRIEPSGDLRMQEASSQDFVIKADPHHVLLDVRVDGDSVGAVKRYVLKDIREDHRIEARFAPVMWRINARSDDSNGSVSPGGNVKVMDGSSKTFRVVPAPHCHLRDLVVDGKSVGALTNYRFTDVSGNHSIVAHFAESNWPVVASAGDGGSITPEGTTVISDGDTITYAIKPARGHRIDDVTVDGVSVGPVSSYTFRSVIAGHTVIVSFKRTSGRDL